MQGVMQSHNMTTTFNIERKRTRDSLSCGLNSSPKRSRCLRPPPSLRPITMFGDWRYAVPTTAATDMGTGTGMSVDSYEELDPIMALSQSLRRCAVSPEAEM